VNTNELQAKLLIYYQVKFPMRARMSIQDFIVIPGATASEVYRYILSYEMNDTLYTERRILKLYANRTLGADRAVKESHALRKLSSEGFPVPGSVLVEVDAGHLGGPFVIMEHIEGQLMWEIIEGASNERRQQLIELLGGLLADLHSLPSELLVPNLIVANEYTLIKRELYNLKQLGSEIEPVVEWLTARRDLVPCKRPRITHRDFHPWNIIITESGDYEGIIIDWGWQISDPRFDLGWTLTLLERGGYHELRDTMLAEYERQTGASVEHLAYFEVLANAYWLMYNVHALKNLQNGRRAALTANIRSAVSLIHNRAGVALPAIESLLM
jgi:aminoglycoside phosphotransferase (APT) family kinase protein